jgi:hypothetical protein
VGGAVGAAEVATEEDTVGRAMDAGPPDGADRHVVKSVAGFTPGDVSDCENSVVPVPTLGRNGWVLSVRTAQVASPAVVSVSGEESAAGTFGARPHPTARTGSTRRNVNIEMIRGRLPPDRNRLFIKPPEKFPYCPGEPSSFSLFRTIPFSRKKSRKSTGK